MADGAISDEQEKHAKQLKRDLEGWREVVIPVHSLLLWDKNWYPGVLVGATSTIFLLFWYLDPSVLTTICVVGMMVMLVDFLVPMITANICNPDSWTGPKERKLEEICRSVSNCQIQTSKFCSNIYSMRNTRPKVYYSAVVTSLVFLAWLGNVINNLLLTYLAATVLVLLPGLMHQGILQKCTSQIASRIAGATKSLKEKKK